MEVVIDACALLHAKQLGGSSLGLSLLAHLAEPCDLNLHVTKAIQGEQVAMSLSSFIEEWLRQDRWRCHKLPATRVKALRNKLGSFRPMPGSRDLALVALAFELKAVLVTHDDPAAAVARKLGVVVVDLLDLGVLRLRRDKRFDIDATFDSWNQSAWRPQDWKGSARATLACRPYRERLQSELERRAGCSGSRRPPDRRMGAGDGEE